MKKILFTSPVMEYPAAGGPQLRIENSVRALCQLAEVHIISRSSPHEMGGAQAEAFYQRLAAHMELAPSVKRNLFARIRAKVDRKFGTAFGLKADCRRLQQYIEENNIEILWCGYGNISYPLIAEMRRRIPHLKIVCDTDSVWSRFILRELDVEQDVARRAVIKAQGEAKEQEEKLSIVVSDVTAAVSEEDARYYRSIASDVSRVHICSNVINLDSYAIHQEAPLNYHAPALFLGGSYYSEYSPMVRAAQWVVQEVMPLVWKKCPQAHLYLVGRDGEKYCSDLVGNNVSVTGKVPTVLPYLQNAACSLVPLQFESGTRFKILESGACCIPVVSTTLGAEGIPVVHGQDILLADTPQEFAQSVLTILADPAAGRNLAVRCRALVEQHYSISALEREMSRIISYLEDKK